MEKIRILFHFISAAVISLLSVLMSGCVFKLPGNIKAQKNIEYAQAGERDLKLDIYSPKKQTKKLPAIVWLFGGGWNSGTRKFCPIAKMAQNDVIIVSIDYRLSGEAKFPAQIFDCKGAIRWLRANAEKYNIDADHIGVFGVSAGGHLAALLATTANIPAMEGDVGGNLNFASRVQCVCAFYPPTDLNRLVSDPDTRKNPKGTVAQLLGGPVADNVDKANFASPVFYVSKDTAPVFLMHGDKDKLVLEEQSRIFYDALKKAGVDVTLEIIHGKGHGITAPAAVAQKIYSFFQKYLLNG